MVSFIFFLNILALSPIPEMLNEGGGAIFLRIVQIATFILSIQYMNFQSNKKSVALKIITILILFFVAIFISEIFHEPNDFLSLFRHLIHILYIIGLIYVCRHISFSFFEKCVRFLFWAYIIEAVFYLSYLGIDSFNAFGGLNELQKFKSVKYEISDSGFALQKFHIIPFVTLWLFPFVTKFTRRLILLLGVLVIMLLSLTFTALISYLLVCIAYLYFIKGRKLYQSKFVFILLLIASSILIILTHYFPMELFKITTGRATLWEQSVVVILDNPLWGCSMDYFYSNMESYLIRGSFANYVDFNYIDGMFDFTSGSCHNNYLGIIMNYGIIVGCLFLWLIFTLWDTAVKRNKNMVYLLPFLYLIIRGFGEFGGIIGNSSSNLDFLFDIYIIGVISIPEMVQYDRIKYNKIYER